MFAGVAGTYLGSSLGKAFDGQKLPFLFALLMALGGVLMLKNAAIPATPMSNAVARTRRKCLATQRHR